MGRNKLIARLRRGLCKYGDILKFKIEQDEIVPNCAMTRAIAIISPNDAVLDNLSVIPRVAFIYDSNDTPSREFKVTPENALKTCNHSQAVGHIAIAYPSTVDKITLLMADMDVIEEDDLDTTTALPYP